MWKKIKKAMKKAANAVANAVSKAADAVADVIETVGNAISDGLSWVRRKVPVVGGVFGWLGGIVAGVTDFISGAIKAVGAIVGGVVSGLIKIIGGILTLDLDNILDGFRDIVSGIAGAVIIVLGKLVALVQVIFTIGTPRPLNDLEKRLIKLVFEDSITTYNVRVVEGSAGLFTLNDRPFVLGNTIYMKGFTSANNPETFVHECVHIWQNQHVGPRYAAEALGSQWWGVAYDWEKEANADKEWEDFEREAQAEIIEAIYVHGGTKAGVVGNGEFFAEPDETLRVFMFKRVDWTELANEATRTIRGKTPWRLSGLFG